MNLQISVVVFYILNICCYMYVLNPISIIGVPVPQYIMCARVYFHGFEWGRILGLLAKMW